MISHNHRQPNPRQTHPERFLTARSWSFHCRLRAWLPVEAHAIPEGR
jgi:hypothetical protein